MVGAETQRREQAEKQLAGLLKEARLAKQARVPHAHAHTCSCSSRTGLTCACSSRTGLGALAEAGIPRLIACCSFTLSKLFYDMRGLRTTSVLSSS
eukprot:3562322-Pleurochrysis_carterae.AAC.3